MTELWRAADNGKAFIAAAEERGYKIAKGDRRDFVVVDHAGDVHSLARRLDGVRVADLRAKFADIDRDSLPSAAEARTAQRMLQMEQGGNFDRDAADSAWNDAVSKSAIAQQKIREAQDRRAAYIAKLRANAPFTKIEERLNRALEGSDGKPEGFAKALSEQHIALARVTEGDLKALGDERARLERHNALSFAAGASPKLAQLPPSLEKDQLVAISSTGRIHKLNEHKFDLNDVAGRYKQSAGMDAPSVVETRDQTLHNRAQRNAEREKSKQAREDNAFDRATTGSTSNAQQMNGKPSGRGQGQFSVTRASTGIADTLCNFVLCLIDPSPPKPMSREERSLAERRSERALDNLKRSDDRGEPFKDHDIAALTRHHLLQIREQGDPYLRDLLAKRHREQQRYLGNERER